MVKRKSPPKIGGYAKTANPIAVPNRCSCSKSYKGGLLANLWFLTQQLFSRQADYHEVVARVEYAPCGFFVERSVNHFLRVCTLGNLTHVIADVAHLAHHIEKSSDGVCTGRIPFRTVWIYCSRSCSDTDKNRSLYIAVQERFCQIIYSVLPCKTSNAGFTFIKNPIRFSGMDCIIKPENKLNLLFQNRHSCVD